MAPAFIILVMCDILTAGWVSYMVWTLNTAGCRRERDVFKGPLENTISDLYLLSLKDSWLVHDLLVSAGSNLDKSTEEFSPLFSALNKKHSGYNRCFGSSSSFGMRLEGGKKMARRFSPIKAGSIFILTSSRPWWHHRGQPNCIYSFFFF